MPPDMDIGGGYTIRWDAVSPTDGSQITGVVVSNARIFGDANISGSAGVVPVGPYMLVPGPNA